MHMDVAAVVMLVRVGAYKGVVFGETVITGCVLDLVRACRINSVWLILQRLTHSENSVYSSSVKRVLITRRRWGVLYLFMAVNLLSWVDFFKRRKP